MFERIHQKLGTAGFIISIIALVAALGGGAYAASGGLNGKEKKEVKKIAKQYAGKPGANGANGAAGAAGPKGDAGASGGNGTDGKSVTVTEIEPEEFECDERGGAEVMQEGASSGVEVCNGAEGSPWTLGGKLPSGATLTGTWSASGLEGAEVYVPISFPIPLGNEILGAKAHLVPAGGEGSCTGSNVEPTAPKGELCIYKSEFTGATSLGIWDPAIAHGGSGTTGAILILEGLTTSSYAFGTWAVTEG